MTDIIERAARAVAAIDYRREVRDCARPADPPVFTPVPWDDLPAKAQLESMEKARAVLRAIREPTPWMKKAGAVDFGGRDWMLEELWAGVIDAALGEE
ncbi:MAG: hypothetical protein Unbinned273contig1001_73 [Prokaryotic dsDNA virus sp.]|nr:MAG: hypothetical protein Unbinned273contig1001_73 [Prokaryotic dsDNA virus sp.]|tara:strand:+ start:35007 stop:35300 length:294 start_codon:yes stop_codon:yes gene_type:complete